MECTGAVLHYCGMVCSYGEDVRCATQGSVMLLLFDMAQLVMVLTDYPLPGDVHGIQIYWL